MKAKTYEERMRKGIFMHNGELLKLLFVKDGKKDDRLNDIGKKKKGGRLAYGKYEQNMKVIFPKRVFNLNYKCERLQMNRYLINIEMIDEKYSIDTNGRNVGVICDSLLYAKKKRESPTFHLIEGANLANLEQRCKGIKERGK